MHLQEIGLDPEAGLAAAGPTHDQNVFVPGRLGVFGAAGHGEALGLSQDNVIFKLGGHVRLNVLGIAP